MILIIAILDHFESKTTKYNDLGYNYNQPLKDRRDDLYSAAIYQFSNEEPEHYYDDAFKKHIELHKQVLNEQKQARKTRRVSKRTNKTSKKRIKAKRSTNKTIRKGPRL